MKNYLWPGTWQQPDVHRRACQCCEILVNPKPGHCLRGPKKGWGHLVLGGGPTRGPPLTFKIYKIKYEITCGKANDSRRVCQGWGTRILRSFRGLYNKKWININMKNYLWPGTWQPPDVHRRACQCCEIFADPKPGLCQRRPKKGWGHLVKGQYLSRRFRQLAWPKSDWPKLIAQSHL